MCVTGASCCLAAALLWSQAQGGDDPPLTVGGRPGRLAHLAARIELDRSAVGTDSGQIVISDHNLQTLAARGRLTAVPTAAWSGPVGTSKNADKSSAQLADQERKWRGRYRRQLAKVRTLETRLATLDRRLKALEDAATSVARSLRQWAAARAKLESARSDRAALAERLDDERAELERIIREARREGAQPGWFR
jgi:septal ring factor EnvC (AmiA/AmiB activator)